MPADRMTEKTVVEAYVSVLLQMAGTEEDDLLQMAGQLDDIRDAFQENSANLRTFEDESLPVDVRTGVAQEVFGEFDAVIQGVLCTMISRGDIALVPRVSEQFALAVEQKLDAVLVSVVTVVELDDHLRDLIGNKLAADFGKRVILCEEIDPSIVGGIIMSAHGRRIDASVASLLEAARAQLAQSPGGGED